MHSGGSSLYVDVHQFSMDFNVFLSRFFGGEMYIPYKFPN